MTRVFASQIEAALMKLSGTPRATVLCMVEEERPLGEGIRALPWWDHRKIWE